VANEREPVPMVARLNCAREVLENALVKQIATIGRNWQEG
jgi:hypothetical protein